MEEKLFKNSDRKYISDSKFENRLHREYEMVQVTTPEHQDDTYEIQRTTSYSDHKSIDNMHKFAREGEANQLASFIVQNRKKVKKIVNVLDLERMSALHYAARFNHLDCVKILVEEAGANVNVLNEEKATPIHFAARYRRKARKVIEIPSLANISDEMQKRLIEEEKRPTKENSVILYLVSKNANANFQDRYGCTALHYAAIRGNEVAAEQLLMMSDIAAEIKDNESMTPLHLAAAYNQYEIARMLINKITTLFNKEETGCIPFHIASGQGNFQLANLLIKTAEEKNQLTQMLNVMNRDYETPLHYAAKNGHYEIAKLCLNKGANISLVNCIGRSVLHLAAHFGNVNVVKLLISFNADLNVRDKFMQTPMHSACEKNHVEIIEYLINQGIDMESRDLESFTPLLIAAKHGNSEAIKLLLKNNCDISCTEKRNKSSLYLAVEHNYSDTVKTILNYENCKKLLLIPDFRGNYPLHIACKNGNVKIVQFLLNAGAIDDAKNEEERTPMHLSAKFGRTNIVKILCERLKRTLITDEDEDSNTPLHLAARSGYPKVIQLLLNYGADKNGRNCNKLSALDLSTIKGNWKAAQVLLENGAEVDSKDKTKITPLYLACKHGHDRLVTLLLRYNADISIRLSGDINDPLTGCNPLDAAIDNGHRQCALAILNTDHWETALRNQTKSLKGYIETPMRKLIQKMPDIAEEVFKKCKESNGKHPDHIDYAITYNFEYLEDSYASWGIHNYNEKEKIDFDKDDVSEITNLDAIQCNTYNQNEHLSSTAKLYCQDKKVIRNNHPLMVMVRKRRENLLNYHIVANLLNMKWNNFGMVVYYANLAIYLFFLLSLLTYMIDAEPPFKYYIRNNKVGLNTSTCEKVKQLFVGEKLKHSAILCKYFIIVLTAVGLIKEAIQLSINRAHYLSFENVMEWIMYILAFGTVVDISTCQSEIGIREHWQWQTGAVSSFMATMNLVLFIRKVPFFGIFVVMFTDVLWTFMKFLPIFFLFIFSFAFAFYVLLNNQVTFHSLLNSVIQTTVMAIGELEFDSVFNTQWEEFPPENRLIFYDEVTYTIFGLFLIIMSIITMNLLVGLAVDDIKAVQEKATLERMGMQVTLALEVEGMIPEFIRRRYIIRKLTVYPNREYNIFKTIFGLGRNVRRQIIKEDQMNEHEKIQRYQKATTEELTKMKFKIEILNSHSQTITNMLAKILKNLKIDFQEEDIPDEE